MRSIFIIFKIVCVRVYSCVYRYVHMRAGAPEVGGLDSPVATVISGCEPADKCAETGTQVLCKKSTY